MTQTALIAVKKASMSGIGSPLLQTGRARRLPPARMAKAKPSSSL